MKNQFKFITLLLLVCSINLFGQDAEAYIVNAQGEKINGYIMLKNWDKNPGSIRFKQDTGSEWQEYNPENIQEFGVRGVEYIAANVELETKSLSSNNLDNDPELNLNNESVFLKKIVKGEKPLYYHKANSGRVNFFISGKEDVELLVYNVYLGSNNSKRENRYFVGQLSEYLDDCEQINSYLMEVEYTFKGLTNLFSRYQECSNADIEIIETSKVKGTWGITGGVSNSSISFEGDNGLDYLRKSDFSSSINPTLGIFATLPFPGNLGNVKLHNELLYTAYQSEGYYEDSITQSWQVNYNTDLNFSYIKLNTLIRLSKPVGRSTVNLDLGMSNAFAIKSEQTVTEETIFGSSVTTDTRDIFQDIRTYEQSLVAGIGLKMDRLGFNLRYERGNGFVKVLSLNSTTTRLFFLVSYTL